MDNWTPNVLASMLYLLIFLFLLHKRKQRNKRLTARDHVVQGVGGGGVARGDVDAFVGGPSGSGLRGGGRRVPRSGRVVPRPRSAALLSVSAPRSSYKSKFKNKNSTKRSSLTSYRIWACSSRRRSRTWSPACETASWTIAAGSCSPASPRSAVVDSKSGRMEIPADIPKNYGYCFY